MSVQPLWNNDTLLALLDGGQFTVDTDNDGQIIIYTGLRMNAQGYLIPFESE